MLKNSISINKELILEALFQENDIAILVVDKKRNNIMANNTFCEMFGYTLEEILETDVRMFHIDNKHYKDFEKLAFNHLIENTPMSLNYQFKKKYGTTFWVKISGNTLKSQKYTLWTLVDITENIEIKKELESQKELLKTVIDETPYPIILKDYDAKFVLVNKATAKLYGCPDPNEMIGKDDGDYILDKKMTEFFRKNVREIMDKNETEIVYEDSMEVKTNEVRNYMSIKNHLLINMVKK